MPILPPIAPIAAGAVPITAPPITAATRTAATDETTATGSATDFGNALTGALDNLQAQERTTDELARTAATGDLNRIEDLMVASTETQLTTQLTVAVRNRAVESFNEIMRMQL